MFQDDRDITFKHLALQLNNVIGYANKIIRKCMTFFIHTRFDSTNNFSSEIMRNADNFFQWILQDGTNVELTTYNIR